MVKFIDIEIQHIQQCLQSSVNKNDQTWVRPSHYQNLTPHGKHLMAQWLSFQTNFSKHL